LNDTDLRVRVVMLLGWTAIRFSNEVCRHWAFNGLLPGSNVHKAYRGHIPDYEMDLNSMHEAEKVLEGPAFFHCDALLGQRCVDEECLHLASATTRQRAMTFVAAVEKDYDTE